MNKRNTNSFTVQKTTVIDFLKKERRMTRNCLLKKLGFKPDLERLIREKIIQLVAGSDTQYELVPESSD